MKRILTLWLAAALVAAQPCYAVVTVGFGQSTGGGGGPIAFPVAATVDNVTGTSDTSVVVPVPTGTSAGDCLIFVGGAAGRAVTPPGGLTQLASTVVNYNGYVWFKKATASESAYTFTAEGTYSYMSVSALRVTGAVCDSSSDFTVTTAGSASSTDTVLAPDITTPQDNMTVLWIELGDTGFTANSNSRGGATERADFTGGTTGTHMSIWSEPIASAGLVSGADISRSGWSGYDSYAVGIKEAP